MQGTHLMVCFSEWHLPGSPKLVWHSARLIKEGGCVDQSMDTLHLKYSLIPCGSEYFVYEAEYSHVTTTK